MDVIRRIFEKQKYQFIFNWHLWGTKRFFSMWAITIMLFAVLGYGLFATIVIIFN
jgi:hypothetical protein